MGCLSRFFCFTSSRRHDPSEDQFNQEFEIVVAMSKLDQDQIAQQIREEDEQLAWAIQESLNQEESSHRQEEERQRARAELEDNQQRAQNVRNSTNEDETLQGERQDKRVQLKEDESLAETRQRQEKGKGKHSEDQVEEDLQLRVDLQEPLHMKLPPSICDGCNSAIQHGRYLNTLGAVWHPECFCCLACHTPIGVHEFSNSIGRFHKSCYKELSRPNCYVCKQKIPSTAAGVVYKEHPFWLEKYCPSHEVDGTSKCCSCERLVPIGTDYVILDDGRRLCLECLDSAILDTYECQTLHFDIRDFFGSLNLIVEKEFPLLLVETQALNKAEEEEKIDRQHAVVTRGLCLSEEQIVSSISKGPEKGPNNRLTGMTMESHTLTRTCEVTAILIVYGLPRLLTGSILAHEMMHAWLRLKGYRKLKPEQEEGICQVLALMWLESQTYSCNAAAVPSSSSSSSYSAATSKKGDQPEFERRLVDFFKWQIQEDKSPVYGVGFRKVNMTVEKDGFHETLRSWRAH